jgi:hypothetical protein
VLVYNKDNCMDVVFFLLGDSQASEFYVLTVQNTVCSIFIAGVSKKNQELY